jgi:hypothetical protein
MAEIIACPNCQRKLQVPEQYLGKKVQCPDCQHMFTAETTAVSAQPASAPSAPPAPKSDDRRRGDDYDDEDDRPSRRGRYDDDEDDDLEYDDIRRRRRHHDFAPHRGGLILALGIVGLVGWLVCTILIVLGPIAWILGSADLREIHAGRMDPDGKGLTRAGQVCGIIGTIFMILGLLAIGLFVVLNLLRNG